MLVDCAWYVGLCLYLGLLIVDSCWFGDCFSIWVDWCECWFTIIVLPATMLYLYCYVLGCLLLLFTVFVLLLVWICGVAQFGLFVLLVFSWRWDLCLGGWVV